MNFRTKSITASLLSAAMLLSMAGCASKDSTNSGDAATSTPVVKKDFFEQMEEFGTFKNVSKYSMSFSVEMDNVESISANIDGTASESAAHFDTIKFIANDNGNVVTIDLPNIYISETDAYISMDSFKNFTYAMNGEPVSEDTLSAFGDAEYLLINFENSGLTDTITGYLPENTDTDAVEMEKQLEETMTKLQTLYADTIYPELVTNFSPLKDTFMTTEGAKSTITIDKDGVIIIMDKIIEMADNGSIKKIYDASQTTFADLIEEAGVTADEEDATASIEELKASINELKEYLPNFETLTLTLSSTLTGDEGSRKIILDGSIVVTPAKTDESTNTESSMSNSKPMRMNFSISFAEGVSEITLPATDKTFDISSMMSDSSISTPSYNEIGSDDLSDIIVYE